MARVRPRKQQNRHDVCEESRRFQFTADDLHALIIRLASVTTHSFRFLSDNDHLLHTARSVALHTSLSFAATSLSFLHSLLPPSSSALPSPTPIPSNSTNRWFPRFILTDSDSQWLETFRMSKPSFFLLLQTLSPSLPSNDTSFPPDHKLAAALLRLAHAAPFWFIAGRFGLDGPQHACRGFYEVCKAVIDQLGHLFDLDTDVERVQQGFRWMSLPGCCGAVGFQRFLVEKKKNGGVGGSSGSVKDDACDKSVIVQAVVDSEGRFLDVSAGWRGVLQPSDILMRSKDISFTTFSRVSESTYSYFVGASCCPLLPWLLTPFDEPDTANFRAFNDAHSQAMKVVAQAFRILRGRWRLLLMSWKEECLEALPFVIITCGLLHNFLFMCSEKLPVDIDENEMEQCFDEFDGEMDEDGERIRKDVASQMRGMVGCI